MCLRQAWLSRVAKTMAILGGRWITQGSARNLTTLCEVPHSVRDDKGAGAMVFSRL